MMVQMDLIHRIKPSHLRLVVRIAETGKLQVAAESLYLSQPAASRTLADLESAAGSPLFERHPKGMIPTPVGEAFIRHARVVLAELDLLGQEVRNLKDGQMGNVRVGSVTGPAVSSLVPAVQAVRKEAPDIEISIEVGPSNQLVRALDEGALDFVLARLPSEYDSRALRVHPARNEVVSLVVKDTHPLAGKKNVGLDELLDYDWVIQERGSPIRQSVENAYYAARIPTPTRVVHSSSLLVVLAMLADSDSISPQSREVAELLTSSQISSRLTTLDIDTTITVTPFFIIQDRTRQLSRAADRLLQEILLGL